MSLAMRAAADFGAGWTEYCIYMLVFLLIAVGLQYRNAAFHNGFGSHPDEPAHYVTGLMVYKYLTTSFGASPMRFAERFYAHYPVVAFGHWPPLFYILQAAWGLLFGLSGTSALILMAVFTSLVSTLIYYAVRTSLGRAYAVACAFLFPVLPIVQQHAAGVMAEVPLTLLSFAAVLAFARLLDKPATARAFWSGLFLCSAIYIKGSGWALMALPFLALLLTRSMSSVLSRHIWVPMMCALLVCCPMTWITMPMTKDGWEHQSFSISFFYHALPALLRFHYAIIGLPLFAFACAGAFVTVVRPFLARLPVGSIWACNFALVGSVLLFHAVVPTSLEARKVVMSIPSLLMFAGAGFRIVAGFLMSRFPAVRFSTWAPCAAVVLIAYPFVTRAYAIPHANMGAVAQRVLDSRNLDRSVVLVASTEASELAELSFTAELAAREDGTCRHAVVRAGKFIADSSWLGFDYRLRFSTPAQVNAAARAVPVSAIVCYSGVGPSTFHAMLVQELVTTDANWLPVSSEDTCCGRIGLWLSRVRSPQKVRLPEINLVRKLGKNISAEF